MRIVCFHGRRALKEESIFLLAARLFGSGALAAGLSCQVRTPMWPSPPGSPDRAIVRLSGEELMDMTIPRQYDLEIVCDPLLAVIPPMGNALLPGGRLLANTASLGELPPGAPEATAADFFQISGTDDTALACALAGGAWAALRALAPEFGLTAGAILLAEEEGAHTLTAERRKSLLQAGYALIENLR